MGMFSVMTAFSFRAYQRYRELASQHRFDIVHDDQGLGYGVLLIKATGVPVVANIHHPLSIDRMNAVMEAPTLRRKVRRIVFSSFCAVLNKSGASADKRKNLCVKISSSRATCANT